MMVPPAFFSRCALVCVDIQEGTRRAPLTDSEVPRLWRRMGFTTADVNAAEEFLWQVAIPNTTRVGKACLAVGLPRVFIHWGCLFPDGMDLDPAILSMQREEHGNEDLRWVPHVSQPGNRPAAVLGLVSSDYVVPKTGQDAFSSSNLGFLLENLKVARLVFVGGHTGACLGKTAITAKARGFETLCVHDATFDARESSRLPNLERCGFDHVVSAAELLACLSTVGPRGAGGPDHAQNETSARS